MKRGRLVYYIIVGGLISKSNIFNYGYSLFDVVFEWVGGVIGLVLLEKLFVYVREKFFKKTE